MSAADLPEHWTATSLGQFLRCSLSWYFAKVARLEEETLSTNLVLGSAIHHAHAFGRSRQKARESVAVAELVDTFTTSWDILSADPRVIFEEGERESLRDEGIRLVEVLARELGDEEVLAVEEEFRVPLAFGGETFARPLVGVLDLVTRDREGQVTVVDLKTAAARWAPARLETDVQATCYALAGQTLYPGSVLFRFDVLLKQKKFPRLERMYAVRDASHFRRLLALVRAAERAIEAGAYVPAEGSWACAGCGYRGACSKWSALPVVAA